MGRSPQNMAASIRQRLLNLARENGRDFNVVLVAFGLERLIYRVSVSAHKDRFVLKGGMLVTLWTTDEDRFTRDVDFLGFGAPHAEDLKTTFAEILEIDAGDGLVFDIDTLTASAVREDGVYGGIRLKTTGYLGNTRIPITVDIGFGDAISGSRYIIEYPSLLDLPTARIRAYSPAVVIAEKFQAIVVLGLVNGRMKDFYDLWTIPRTQDVPEAELSEAIAATFERRATDIPRERPDGLSEAFTSDRQKATQWSAYAASINLEDVTLPEIADGIWARLGPICKGIA